jgi:hypothetical protein
MDWVIFDNTSVIEITLKKALNLASVYQILRGIPECIYKGLTRKWGGMAGQGATNLSLRMEFGHEFNSWRLSHYVWRRKVVNVSALNI